MKESKKKKRFFSPPNVYRCIETCIELNHQFMQLRGNCDQMFCKWCLIGDNMKIDIECVSWMQIRNVKGQTSQWKRKKNQKQH